MTETVHLIEKLTPNDAKESVALISCAMNPSEGQWAEQTLIQYFASEKNGIDDGRTLFVWRADGKIGGVVGLHHYLWGPEQNVWLS